MTEFVGLDTEFTSLRHAQGRVLCAVVADEHGASDHTPAKLRQTLRFVDSVGKMAWALHNAKADFTALGVWPKAPVFDTLVASWLLNENGSHKLEDLTKKYLWRDMEKPIRKKDGKLYWKDYKTPLEEAPYPELLAYCIEDTKATRQLAYLFEPALEAEGLLDWFWDIEMPFAKLLWEMESRGIKVDLDKLSYETNWFKGETMRLHAEVQAEVGYPFNPNSDDQLRKILYTKKWEDSVRGQVGTYKNGNPKMGRIPISRRGFGLKPKGKKTPGGLPSTNKDALAHHVGHPFVDKLLEYRKVEKILETLEAYPQFMHEGRLHGKLKQTGTVTGRLSSSEPNQQNVPVRGEYGPRVRGLFVPEQGNKLVISDLSQVEYRLLADFADEWTLIEGFLRGEDFHENTAKLLYSLDREPTKAERTGAKNTSYGLVYGAGPGKVAQMNTSMGVPTTRAQAQALSDTYYEVLPGVTAWKAYALSEARRKGYVMTIGGRKRRLPELSSYDSQVRSRAERQAINSIIQGSAADLIKVAMLKMDQEGVPLLLQVHDEVIAEVPEEDAELVAKKVEAAFEETARSFGLRVPITCDSVIADSWAEKK